MTTYAGAFNFAFVRFDNTDGVEAANIDVRQLNTGNANAIQLSLEGATENFHLTPTGSNRGDYSFTIGDNRLDDGLHGLAISAIRNNGRDHGQGQGVQYGAAVTLEEDAGGGLYIPLFDHASAEYNADIASTYFTYDRFTAAWARNSVNGGQITDVRSSADVVWGENFTQVEAGVFSLKLDGVNAIEDGVLLVIGGKNEGNRALSRPLDDGSGFLIGSMDTRRDGADYEQDPVAFVFLEEGKSDLTFGRVLSDGSSTAGQGDYHIEVLSEGRYRLTIDGATPADGALVLSSEGFDLLNQDNIVSYEADGDGWIIETRDAVTLQLQSAGESVYKTLYDDLPLPEIDPAYVGTIKDSIAIWQNADVDYAFVMGHRGGLHEANATVAAEYSLGSIDRAAAMGQNMIEIDVRKTGDGQYVILHDATLDRTTNGTGDISGMTLEQIREARLMDPVTGAPLNEGVATLEEFLQASRDKVMLSIDVKPGVSDYAAVMEIVAQHGMVDHVVLQHANVSSQQDLDMLAALLRDMPAGTDLIPSINDTVVTDLGFVRQILETLRPNGLAINVGIPDGDLTPDGGPLFSDEMRALADEFDVRLTVNSLNSGYQHTGNNNGLRNDYLGMNDPDAAWGFWIEKGADAMLIDEARIAIDYLNATGARFALDGNTIFGSGADETLVGTDGDDIIFSLAGRLDRMTGGDGADVFVFGNETRNGTRETDYITDYTAGEDAIRLGDATVASYREMSDRVRLELSGDGDIVWVQGTGSFDDLIFV